MFVDQLDHKYELKVDLGDYQTGLVELYVLANLASDVAVDDARLALQDMASRNVRVFAHRLRPNGKETPAVSLGLMTPGVTVAKLGVGFGKKLKIGKQFGVSNRELYGRIWGQLEPDDDPGEAAATLWDYAVRAFEEKLAALTPVKNDGEPKPESSETESTGQADSVAETGTAPEPITVPLERAARQNSKRKL